MLSVVVKSTKRKEQGVVVPIFAITLASEKAAKQPHFQRGVLGATLSGLAFYKSKGWSSMAEEQATLPDGVVIGVVRMEKL